MDKLTKAKFERINKHLDSLNRGNLDFECEVAFENAQRAVEQFKKTLIKTKKGKK